MKTKVCSKCKQDKLLTEYYPIKCKGISYLCAKCITCYTEYYETKKEDILLKSKKHYETNKENILITQKKYYKDNKKDILSKVKSYQKTNKDKLSKKRNITLKNKRNINHIFKLSGNIRTAVGNSIKRNNSAKKTKTTDILGCSFTELKRYLETQFLPWMSWYNYGKYNGTLDYGWDIDHIIPISSAITEQELLKLNHHSNLQPLCSKINRDIKKNKV